MDFISKDGFYRVFSFQSLEVVDILLRTYQYEPDLNKSREHHDYKLDIEQLGGKNPIWGFTLPSNIETARIYDGTVFSNFGCEMSVTTAGLDRFYMLELLIPKHSVKVGKTHNAYKYAVVFPIIELSNVIAIWKVHNTRIKEGNGYPTHGYCLELINKINDGTLFSEFFTTLSFEEEEMLTRITNNNYLFEDMLLCEDQNIAKGNPLPNLSTSTKEVVTVRYGSRDVTGSVSNGILIIHNKHRQISSDPLL